MVGGDLWWRGPTYTTKSAGSAVGTWEEPAGTDGNVFEVLIGPDAENTSSLLYFGLSNRVRSVHVRLEELGGSVNQSSSLNNNRFRGYLGRVRPIIGGVDYSDLESTSIPLSVVYPQRPRFMLIPAGNFDDATPDPQDVTMSFNVEQDIVQANTYENTPESEFHDFVYGCGFGMCLEARLTGGTTKVANWRFTITPSETPIP